MNNYKILKCPSCGASLVETQSESILECSHCGTNLVSKETDFKALKSDNTLIKKLLFLVIMLIVVSLILTIFWFLKKPEGLNQSSSQSPKAEVTSKIHNTNSLIKAPISIIPQLKTNALEVNKENIEKFKASVDAPKITIVSNLKGETIIGDHYWIVTVRNDSKTQIIKPRVIMSLFDKNKRRIGEHTGWAKLDVLEAGSEATVLVLNTEPPKVEFTTEFNAIAAYPNKFMSNVIHVRVDDFIVNPNKNSDKKVTIIGDVSNPNEFRVDFIRVEAIAKNKQGVAVGIANAYVTKSSLANNEKSGFKIKVSTFITEPAATWALWASGRKHRDK